MRREGEERIHVFQRESLCLWEVGKEEEVEHSTVVFSESLTELTLAVRTGEGGGKCFPCLGGPPSKIGTVPALEFPQGAEWGPELQQWPQSKI